MLSVGSTDLDFSSRGVFKAILSLDGWGDGFGERNGSIPLSPFTIGLPQSYISDQNIYEQERGESVWVTLGDSPPP